jgi:flagellar basal body-associated protein FliL
MTPSINPFLIPIVFLLGAFAVGIAAMILNSQAKERKHRERMYLAEKGMDIPTELYEVQKQEVKENGYKGGRIWLIILGLLCIFIGLSVIIMLSLRGETHDAVGGIVPVGIGLAFLLSERIVARMAVKDKE